MTGAEKMDMLIAEVKDLQDELDRRTQVEALAIQLIGECRFEEANAVLATLDEALASASAAEADAEGAQPPLTADEYPSEKEKAQILAGLGLGTLESWRLSDCTPEGLIYYSTAPAIDDAILEFRLTSQPGILVLALFVFANYSYELRDAYVIAPVPCGGASHYIIVDVVTAEELGHVEDTDAYQEALKLVPTVA